MNCFLSYHIFQRVSLRFDYSYNALKLTTGKSFNGPKGIGTGGDDRETNPIFDQLSYALKDLNVLLSDFYFHA